MQILLEGDVSPFVFVADPATTFDDNMRPQTTEKHLYVGDTPTFTFYLKDSGVAKNLNGMSVGFAAKTSTAATAFLFNVTATNTDEPNGTAQVTLTAAQTATVGDYVAEITLWGTGSKLTALQFPLVINAKVT